ncbi:MAG TPA: SDR family oxidoreductase, partial [Thermoanaerobaculia bacterium]|nr:SDR family oxidoreductase [Thermoanaerobaculia bacterium]
MGGIGLVLAERLARRVRARLVLVGRSELPPREDWDRLAALPATPGEVGFKVARLREIEAAGGELLLLQADVAEPAQARRIVAAARGRWGRIDGVVHAAGVFPGGLAQLKTRQMVDAVFAPKLAGTLALSAALTDDPPDFFLLCSSLTGIAGSFGLVDHAAANAFLDAYAQAGGLSPRTFTLAVSWDSWLEVGQAAQGARSHLGPSAFVPELTPGTAEPAGHPFLDFQGTAPDGQTVFQSRLSTATHWVVDEHRLLGDGLLPGTAYLEMIRAVVERQAGPGPIEVEDLVFAQPLRVPDGEVREVRVVLAAEGGEVRILSRADSGGQWEEHARCRARLLPEAVAGRHDLAEIQSRCQVREISGENARSAGPLRFGSRWQGLFERVHFGAGEGLAFLRLASEFAADLESLVLHPALLDGAVAFALALAEETESVFLPLAYERAVVLAPLPAAVASHMRLRGQLSAETLSCDVTVMDRDGVERLRVEGFTMKRLRETVPATPAVAPDSSFDAYGEGILPHEGADLFERLLSNAVTSPQVVISLRDLDRVLELAASVDHERLLEHADRRIGGHGLHPRPRLSVAYTKPGNEIEALLADAWGQILGLDRVGVHDNFFDLGGDSLMATRLVSILRREMGAELSLRSLFESPTVAELATLVEKARRGDADTAALPLVPVPRKGSLPLSFAQLRLWFMDQLEPGSPLYNIPAALRIEGLLNSAVWALCLSEIVRRHESLRTVFTTADGAPVQEIRPAVTLALPLVDLSGLPEGLREATALVVAGEEEGRVFDLARGPLLRSVLLRLDSEDHVAVLTMHHIVSDGWSMGILVREMTALYTAFAERRPSPLTDLPVQYGDFSVWQHSWLHGDILENEIAFWRRQLAGLPPTLDLPTDRPRPAQQSFRGASRPVRLQAELIRQVETLSRRE